MKVAPILRALAKYSVTTRIVHTGQHYDAAMSEVFLKQLGIPEPDVHLGIGSGRHGAQTARALESFEAYLLQLSNRPAGVIVVGDVNSTLACALAAVKLGIPVAHVEAGLRSFDRSMPEEINRIVTDTLSDLLFVSEPSGIDNLEREAVPKEKITFAGNVMIDSLVRELPVAKRLNVLDALGIQPQSYALVTLHRPGNVDEPRRLAEITEFVIRTSKSLRVVFPIHPRTRARLQEANLLAHLKASERIILLDPLGYHENLAVLSGSRLALTDSGGIQEETSYLQVPCLTLRPNTERPVTVTHGTNTIIGNDLASASSLITDILNNKYKAGGAIPKWDGNAAERIAPVLVSAWS